METTAAHRTFNKPGQWCAHLVVMSSLVFAGCAHRDGRVGIERIGQLQGGTLEAGRLMKLEPQELFIMPQPLPGGTAAPVYPKELLMRKLEPVTICVDVMIDVHGNAYGVDVMVFDAKCTTPHSALYATFLQAVDQAVRDSWRFVPARVCTFPVGVQLNRDACISDKTASKLGVAVRNVPVSLPYRFEFSQVDGRGMVQHSS